MKIWEQVDSTGDKLRYCWMLSRGYATRAEMIRWGWKWIAGKPRGLFVTSDPAAMNRARDVLRLDAPESNGTHDRIGAPMHAVHAARERVRAEYAVAGLVADAEIDGFSDMTPHQLFAEITYISDYQG